MNIHAFRVVAGAVSSLILMAGTLPMLLKAYQTKDLKSYSLANLVMSNVGNLIHWVYVSSLPMGPVWFLHAFWTVSMLLMLIWYLTYSCYRCVSAALGARKATHSQ